MRVVALLSDFGLSDWYVGVMKAVMLSRVPELTFLDLSHGIAPQQVTAGALALAASGRFLPRGSVVLAVVDPGLPEGRGGIAVEGPAGTAVGPDNGLLTPFLVPGARVFRLTSRAHRLPRVQATFHGRDIYAPAAAWLAGGGRIERLGPAFDDPVRIPLRSQRWQSGTLHGRVLMTDHFGNLVTDLVEEDLPAGGTVWLAGQPLGPLRQVYRDVPIGAPVALVGDSGRLELCVHQGSAARHFGLGAGSPVEVRIGAVL